MAAAGASATDTAVGHDVPWTSRQIVVLFAIALLAAIVRLTNVEQWSWSEAEAATWRAITRPWTGADGLLGSSDAAAPLAAVMLRVLVATGLLPGHGEGWLRLPFAFVGTLVVPLTMLLARRFVGAPAALAGGLALALHPAHLAISQSTRPLGLAVFVALLGAIWLVRGRRGAALATFVAAALAAPVAWATVLAVASTWAPPPWRERLGRGLVAAAAVAAVALVGELTWPLALLGGIGWAAVPAALPRALVAVPLVAAVAAQPFGDAAGFAVPGVCVFAGAGAMQLFAAARTKLRGSPRAAAATAGLAGALAITWLAVDSFLQLTIWRGVRTPWRVAAESVWGHVRGRGGFVVGAGAGALPLACYLEPWRWREPSTSPAVQEVACDPDRAVGALARLSARPEAHVLVVLRSDEVAALPAAARTWLADTFVLATVVSSPQPHGDDTVYVWRRETGR